MDISVITPTYKRPRFLASCLDQVRNQTCNLTAEHIVVSDGVDPLARRLCAGRARYFELDQHKGKTGAYARDYGIEQAKGEYCVFWDDDNSILPHALATQFATAYGHDVGINQVMHWEPDEQSRIIPQYWTGRPKLGFIDSLCICVRLEIAKQVKWVGDKDIEVDADWISRVFDLPITSHFSPVVVGQHVGFRLL